MALPSLDDSGFCGRCWLAIPRIEGLICRTCGVPLKDGGGFCYSCRHHVGLTVRASVEYRGVIRAAVARYKYAGRKSLASSLGALLCRSWDRYPELHGAQNLVPVPLHTRNEKRRGYNQAELLAFRLSSYTKLPVLPLLVRTRVTRSQVELGRLQRAENVRSAFALHPYAAAKRDVWKGRSFLLIDDVCTTTSTLGECARVLLRAGAGSAKALVLARDL